MKTQEVFRPQSEQKRRDARVQLSPLTETIGVCGLNCLKVEALSPSP
jgi:hypothetical protein